MCIRWTHLCHTLSIAMMVRQNRQMQAMGMHTAIHMTMASPTPTAVIKSIRVAVLASLRKIMLRLRSMITVIRMGTHMGIRMTMATSMATSTNCRNDSTALK